MDIVDFVNLTTADGKQNANQGTFIYFNDKYTYTN